MADLSTDKRIWIGTSTTQSFLAWIIRRFTSYPQSHAWISWWDDLSQQRLVAEATISGYSILSWKRWKRKEKGKRVWVFVSSTDLTPGLRRVAENVGTEYDVKNLVWHALRRLFSFWFRRPWRSPNSYICSEAVVYVLQFSNISNSAQLDPEATTPGSLTEWCQNSPLLTSLVENHKVS